MEINLGYSVANTGFLMNPSMILSPKHNNLESSVYFINIRYFL